MHPNELGKARLIFNSLRTQPYLTLEPTDGWAGAFYLAQ
jgi:hypothetical protein